MKKTLILIVISATISLTACSHKNPMETQSQEDTARFLIAASIYASDKMKLNLPVAEKSLRYGDCVFNHMIDSSFCPNFYDYMIEYADKSDSDFSNITIEDLKNREVYRSVEKTYFDTALKNMQITKKK